MKIDIPQKTVFYSIEKAIKSYRQMAQNNINSTGIDITLDQLLLLMTIKDHPKITQVKIAEIIFKDYASVTRMIELLVKKDFVKRQYNEDDRRRQLLTLTEVGEKSLKILDKIILANRQTALQNISEKATKQLNITLSKLTNNCITTIKKMKL